MPVRVRLRAQILKINFPMENNNLPKSDLSSQSPNNPASSVPNKYKYIFLIFAILVLIAAASLIILRQRETPSSNIDNSIPNKDGTEATTDEVASVVNANNQFTLDLYSELNKEDGNIFFSPYSISTALAMTYEGARDKTATEIESVFHFPIDVSVRKQAFLTIHDQINQPNSKYKLSIANALWAQKDYKFLSTYIDDIEKYYAGKATNVDFKNSTEDARQTINNWVADQTNDKIKNLFSRGSLNHLTCLVLTNAIYFKGTWVKEFDQDQTQDDDFRLGSKNTIQVPMMRRTDEDAEFNYSENSDLQVLEMPYEGDKLSMMILLPTDDNLLSLEKNLSLENIKKWKDDFEKQQVKVYVPKFTFNTKYSLNDTLSKMGMPTAFSDKADFSGLNGTKNLSIQSVIHQAFVAVDEEGTEAAAATGVSIGETAIAPTENPIPIFKADHPFIFIIQDEDNGNILFLGRVSDPSK